MIILLPTSIGIVKANITYHNTLDTAYCVGVTEDDLVTVQSLTGKECIEALVESYEFALEDECEEALTYLKYLINTYKRIR